MQSDNRVNKAMKYFLEEILGEIRPHLPKKYIKLLTKRIIDKINWCLESCYIKKT